jgi:hypothetical protein
MATLRNSLKNCLLYKLFTLSRYSSIHLNCSLAITCIRHGRDDSVHIATSWMAEDRFPAEPTEYSLPCNTAPRRPRRSRPALVPIQSPIKCTCRHLSPGIIRLRREADHSLSSNAEIKNDETISPLSHMSSWRST